MQALRVAIRVALPTLLLSSFMTVCAQTDLIVPSSEFSVDRSGPITTSVQEVHLAVSVTHHGGRFVSGLTAADFTIRDNDRIPERITSFDCDTDLPLRIALVLDLSDSVAYELNMEKRAALSFVKNNLRLSDLALLVGFNEHPQILQGATADHELIDRAIKQLPRGGNTALYDAVALAAQELEKIDGTGPVRRAVIVISDGEDNSSFYTLQVAAQIAQQTETAVYVLRVGDLASPAIRDAMKDLSNWTGGRVLGSLEDYTTAFATIDSDLRNQYTIGYIPIDTRPDGTFHRIAVRGPKRLHVHYRQGYFAR